MTDEGQTEERHRPLDENDKRVATKRREETASESAYLDRVIKVFHNFNYFTVTTPEVLSWLAGASAFVAFFGEAHWAVVSGVAAAVSGLLLRIHKVQKCPEFQEKLAARKSIFTGLSTRYDVIVERAADHSKGELADLEMELVKARQMPPATIPSVFGLVPRRED